VCRASAAAAWVGHDSSEVQLELDPSMPIAVTDGERLRTALVNILTNARHAVHAVADARKGEAPDRGAVAVASHPGVIVRTQHAAGQVAISVQDFGTGISPEDLTHIFDPYFTTRRKGTGLGLPIAKNIIEGLGGTITVTSTLGAGTTIRLDMPLTAEALT
jgi:signal transduction histidine kinase